ncbi:DNA polymerase III subunit epsilon [Corynebacterium pygosceleis]|uniref:DNA polymerase III subunit epsilon n=1 Tax=Corynebacterium pygosceleis TaxID=2800406 RepID=A0A9Q4C7W0_9CORY|nr:DNA polymerase III subunit epsilon [Corynebacterium pygosceleis]MCK7637340.1 DNA polymerase III subunit epsilon [Corynebacterium pygosceleis]MCK7675990.1 DNA polymerase III subunit epsilon [Corynebacterium pygosceleis]MCL0119884.1 DNA polymerase III subunit epsilon [Corynebacterium pygosceleis]MCX7445243.1 DNA polymerase III subunit epsilon [Corynebacterium pygosceleis]MCX7468332.1 DNA polymerase III subunit epsilon [Corynebacterium pygosceleis]
MTTTRPDTPDPAGTADTPAARSRDNRDRARRQRDRAAEIAAAPYVAAAIQSTGIHPSTARLVSIDLVTYSATGEEVDTYHAVLDPGTDPGPHHLHGLSPAEIRSGQRFDTVLRSVTRLIDGRTLLVHNAPRVWGFIVSESRRAVRNSTNRTNRGRRSRGRRRRPGHVPRPGTIIDTLATARRRSVKLDDTRIRGVARTLGIDAPTPRASVERAGVHEAEHTRTDTRLVAQLFFDAYGGPAALEEQRPFACLDPADLHGDRFGLQRSHLRVDAADAERRFINPGPWQRGKPLTEGMEIVVSPEIAVDPDEIIAAAVGANLNYSEKLTRATSLVVCNQTTDLSGKAMHAARKGIPLISDSTFLEVVSGDIVPGTRE